VLVATNNGKVVDDVRSRASLKTGFRMTAAEPQYAWFTKLASG